jgi:glutathione S-transferase
MTKSKGQRWRVAAGLTPALVAPPAPPTARPPRPAPRGPAPLLDPAEDRARRAAAQAPDRVAATLARAREFEQEGRYCLADATLARAAQMARRATQKEAC